jgi:endoglycosylceramidase
MMIFNLLLFIVPIISGFISIHNNSFVDEYGSSIIFHGFNIVPKRPPFLPNLIEFSPGQSLVQRDIDLLKDLGVNSIRLGVSMKGLFPSPDFINIAYIDEVTKVVDFLWNNKIYTIIDNHQDLLSAATCGNGFPEWAVHDTIKNMTYMPLPQPIPVNEFVKDLQGNYICPDIIYTWVSIYGSDLIGQLFQSLYDGNSILYFIIELYWKTISMKFKNHPGILGYELLNEPWVGDHLKTPKYITNPKLADKKNLQKFYKNMHDVIRQNDKNHIIFYEPSVWTDDSIEPVGFVEGPGGSEWNHKQSLAFHHYCIYSNPILCSKNDKIFANIRQKDIQRLQTAGFMTEFGAIDTENDEKLNSIISILELADTYNPPLSWSFWNFKTCDDKVNSAMYFPNGTVKNKISMILSRPYVQSIHGIVKYMNFDTTTGTFILNAVANLTQPVVIFLSPKFNYKNGYKININVAYKRNEYEIYTDTSNVRVNLNVKIFKV